MNQAANNATPEGVIVGPVPTGFEARLLRFMMAITAIGAVVALIVGNWRISVGLVIGGALAILNHRWLQSSTAAAFRVLLEGQKPSINLAKYIFRYLAIASAVLVVYELGLAPLTAIIAGLSSFVVAVFVEALRELYFAIIQREEIS